MVPDWYRIRLSRPGPVPFGHSADLDWLLCCSPYGSRSSDNPIFWPRSRLSARSDIPPLDSGRIEWGYRRHLLCAQVAVPLGRKGFMESRSYPVAIDRSFSLGDARGLRFDAGRFWHSFADRSALLQQLLRCRRSGMAVGIFLRQRSSVASDARS